MSEPTPSEPTASEPTPVEPAPDPARPHRQRARQGPRPAPTRRAESGRRAGRAARQQRDTGTTTPVQSPASSERPTRERARAALRRTLMGLWVLVVLAATVGIVAVRVSADVPDAVRQVAAGSLSAALALALAVRTGGRPVWAAVLAAGTATAAFVTGWEPLLDGAAVGTGVLAATLGVMATVPAATVGRAVREALIATAIGWVGALGVVAYGPRARLDVDLVRFGYAVLGLSLVGAIALVYRLGAGLHGLGRRGYVVAGGAVLMLAFALAYSEAIAQWGSRDLVGTIDDFRDSTKDLLGAVPHPIMALLGYPALVWGVFMRARRRQGWWVCAFGVAVTSPTATRLVAQDLSTNSVVLGALYSVLAGSAIGYLVIRVEQSLTGTHGRRARRDEEAEAHRPEPRRFEPLH
ncbi:hypothetical protein [Nocardioides pocheonensis]|uniref:hypothetical protein n=1 Tax=Nocardioides pocheonensis TaxID=661485 RepID=UPI0011CE9ED8|nr:hypothetical protein [Nocardioides pocheonensis]